MQEQQVSWRDKEFNCEIWQGSKDNNREKKVNK